MSDYGEPWVKDESGRFMDRYDNPVFTWLWRTDRAAACVNALAGHDQREVAPWKELEEVCREIASRGGMPFDTKEVDRISRKRRQALAKLDAIRKEKK